jgi:hypothetical protein
MRFLSYRLRMMPFLRFEERNTCDGPTRAFFLIALSAAALLTSSAAAQEALYQPENLGGFAPLELAGFGDPTNTSVTSMEWFQNRLYVGTLRSAHCVFAATVVGRYGVGVYPPPASNCTADPRDLPLAAEIWRFTPKDASWNACIRPRDVRRLRPAHRVLRSARDIAYTSMVFTSRRTADCSLCGSHGPRGVFAPICALGSLPRRGSFGASTD